MVRVWGCRWWEEAGGEDVGFGGVCWRGCGDCCWWWGVSFRSLIYIEIALAFDNCCLSFVKAVACEAE
jgi:hypothetical protein